MKRKYCLVRLHGELGVNDTVFVVWVGSSLRESAKLALVEEYCKDVGWYFKRWSSQVDSALEQRSKLLRVDRTRNVTPYRMIQLNIDECYQTIIDDSWAKIEATTPMTKQEIHMRFRLDPRYLMAYNSKQRNTTCPPYPRKYLSHRNQNAFYGLALPCALIVLLIVLDAIVSNFISSITF